MKLQIVQASQGALWVRQGLRTFMRQPIGLAGLFMLFSLTMMLLHVLPTLGTAIGLALMPAFTAGFVQATQAVEEGRFPRPQLLLSALRASARRPMLVLGALYLASVLLVLLLSVFMDGGTLARIYLLGGALDDSTLGNPGLPGALLLTMVLYLPVSMAFWHAPMLVVDAGHTPLKALFFSFVACKRNLGAFTVYGLGWGLMYLALLMTASTLGFVLGGPALASALAVPFTIIAAAVFFTSIRYSYRDCFAPDTAGDTHDSA
ncbi:MAG: BPSS1780 family membrane protein [Rhodoferax sp.]